MMDKKTRRTYFTFSSYLPFKFQQGTPWLQWRNLSLSLNLPTVKKRIPSRLASPTKNGFTGFSNHQYSGWGSTASKPGAISRYQSLHNASESTLPISPTKQELTRIHHSLGHPCTFWFLLWARKPKAGACWGTNHHLRSPATLDPESATCCAPSQAHFQRPWNGWLSCVGANQFGPPTSECSKETRKRLAPS